MAGKPQRKSSLKLVREGHRLLTEDGQDIMTLAEQNQFKVAAVASAVDAQVQELENAIKKATGSGPKEYFRRHRIILAQRYLRMGYGADQIVSLLGFSHYTPPRPRSEIILRNDHYRVDQKRASPLHGPRILIRLGQIKRENGARSPTPSPALLPKPTRHPRRSGFREYLGSLRHGLVSGGLVPFCF